LSQNVLLDALRAYEGTLLVVSHDRYFLDGLVTRVLELEDGALHDWPGNLSEYIERKGFLSAETRVPQAVERVPARVTDDTRFKSREQKRLAAQIRNRLSSGLRDARRRVEDLQQQIERSEARKREIETELADDELYRDGDKCRALLAEYERLRVEIPRCEEEWAEAVVALEALEREKEQQLKAGAQDT